MISDVYPPKVAGFGLGLIPCVEPLLHPYFLHEMPVGVLAGTSFPSAPSSPSASAPAPAGPVFASSPEPGHFKVMELYVTAVHSKRKSNADWSDTISLQALAPPTALIVLRKYDLNVKRHKSAKRVSLYFDGGKTWHLTMRICILCFFIY